MNQPNLPPAGTPGEADLNAGVAASRQGDSEGALALYERARAAAPANPLVHFLIGSELASLGRFEEAEAALTTAVVVGPHFPLARYQLGLLQFSSGRAAPALATWGPLLEADADSYLACFVRGFAALAADKFIEAREQFERGLALNTENEPLSGDIRLVLARMAGLETPSTEPAEASKSAEEATAHVLLSNYGRYGTLH